MGKTTGIAWTSDLMAKFVAAFTQGDAVIQDKPQFWMIRKRLDVMGVQVPAPRIAAVLARKLVPPVNSPAPSLILGRAAFIQGASLSPALPGIVRWSALHRTALLLGGPHLGDSLGRARLPEAMGIPAVSITHRFLCGLGMRPPFERGGRRWLLGVGDAAARKTRALSAIVPGAIVAEAIPRLPGFALGASAETGSKPRLVVL